jgi:hypothetical protein
LISNLACQISIHNSKKFQKNLQIFLMGFFVFYYEHNPILSSSNIWNQCLLISSNQVIHQFKKPKYFEEFNLVGFTHSIWIEAIKLKNWNQMNLQTNNQTPETILKLKPSLKTSTANNKILLNQNICDWLIS